MPSNAQRLEDVFYELYTTHSEEKKYVLHKDSDTLLGIFWDKMEDAKESVGKSLTLMLMVVI